MLGVFGRFFLSNNFVLLFFW